MSRDSYFGIPDWMVNVAIVFTFIGALTTVGGIVAGIVWLVRHVRFV